MPLEDDVAQITATTVALLNGRIETLIVCCRALCIVSGLLIAIILVGWQSHGQDIARLNKFQKDQAEWNQLILRALWLINDDPKRKQNYDSPRP